MKTFSLYIIMTLCSVSIMAQSFKLGFSKKNEQEEKFEQLMTEIKDMYQDRKFNAHKMEQAYKIHPEDLTLNKIQSIYWLDHRSGRAIKYLNVVLDSLPNDSTWSEKRLQAAYIYFMRYRPDEEIYDLFLTDVNTLRGYHVDEARLSEYEMIMARKLAEYKEQKAVRDSLDQIKYVDIK